jgi:hypothetical protein
MPPKKQKAPEKRWEALTPVEQANLRKRYHREVLSEHQLMRQGGLFRCVCGQCFMHARTQRDAESYMAMHKSEIERRLDNPNQETEYL